LRDPSQDVVTRLFAALHADPLGMPLDWQQSLPNAEPERARHTGDFIAGMTDRYALHCYERLIGPSPLPVEVIL